MTTPQFVFAACQIGSERALKHEVARLYPAYRFAFSRPGFVTFRSAAEIRGSAEREGTADLGAGSVFGRTWAHSVGKVTGSDAAFLARELWSALGAHFESPAALARFRHLHVWARDRALPGDFDFMPGVTAEASAAGATLLRARPDLGSDWLPQLNAAADPGERVLDCVLVEPAEWWFGWHAATRVELRWPGGVPQLTAPANMVSRAYLKMLEALQWSELPLQPGDRCVEIGSAPGGSCQALLERGCAVVGVDPAEIDTRVLAHPKFTHLRARAKDLKVSAFADCRWLMADANVPPKYTLDTVERIVSGNRSQIAGLLLTLKLTDPALATRLPAFAERIRSWGYERVRMRQLAFNRQELCVYAVRGNVAEPERPRSP